MTQRTVPSVTDDALKRRNQLSELAQRRGLEGVVLRRQRSISWLFGVRSNVPQTLDATCFDVIVSADESEPITIVANAIEAPRLEHSELADSPVPLAWRVVPWWTPRPSALPDAGVGTDLPYPGALDLSREVTDLTRRLDASQRATLESLCRDTAAALGAAALASGPRVSEYEAAGTIAKHLLDRDIDPIVLLVAGQERIARDRHPLPTSARLGDTAMLVCCGRRHGLVASATRIVRFGHLNQSERERYQAILEVERVFLDASRPGATLGDVVTEGTDAYARLGFAADEWHRHHQGGLSGWEPREFPAARDDATRLGEGMVVAWNPSGDGWKVEDTCLVESGGGRPLGSDPAWPFIVVGGRARPAVAEV